MEFHILELQRLMTLTADTLLSGGSLMASPEPGMIAPSEGKSQGSEPTTENAGQAAENESHSAAIALGSLAQHRQYEGRHYIPPRHLKWHRDPS